MGESKIRHQFDPISNKWYFSVVDVIGILTKSSNPRNYWKVLKNRLNKTFPELVTKCNQLKMISKDGKYYLTDTADSETIIEIIESVPKASVQALKLLIKNIEENTLGGVQINKKNTLGDVPEAAEMSTDEAKLLIDLYQTPDSLFIEAMVAGVSTENLNVSISSKKVTIQGKRKNPENISAENYLYQELYWTTFSRTISLPCLVQSDKAETSENFGCLKIKLPKQNN